MISHAILNALERRGVDSYTIATWKARLLGRHYQAFLEAAVIAVVLLIVLLFAGIAGAAQEQPAGQPGTPAAMGPKMAEMKPMAEMKQACEAKHEAAASDVQALTKTLTEARASNDIVVLRAALDATLRHLEGMHVKAATCAGMMNTMKAAPPAAAAPKDDAHKH